MKEKYDVLETIEQGDYLNQYKVKLKNTDELKIMKIINKNMIINTLGEDYYKNVFLKSFENMEICGKNNINSVQLFEYSNAENEFICVMELVDEDLGKFLGKRDQGLNPQEILGILKQLNNTFKIMVDNLIVHRDLKLENIFIKYNNNEKSDYTIKLGYYEVSTRLNSLDQKMNLMIGTMGNMAPEMILKKEYDRKCDLWSLGLLIYTLFFKEPPNITVGANFQQPLKTSGNELLDDLLNKLLKSDPENRITWKQYFEHPFFK